jgi:class I fructose-bisphosphate aldolase
LEEIRGLNQGGAFGSIVGRNAFQRPRADSLTLLKQIMSVYKS